MNAPYPVRHQLSNLLRRSEVGGDSHHNSERALLAASDARDGDVDAVLYPGNLQAVAVHVLETLITSDITCESKTRCF